MNRLRLYGRVVRVLAVVSLGLGMASIFALLHRLHLNSAMDRRQRWTQFFMKRLSNALPFQVTVVGERPVTPMLWVSNHVSWTDIALLGQLTPLSFLSKAEVRSWPVAGWLADQAGSLFIRRGAGDSQTIREQMSHHLQQQHPLLMFPEGTTTDGRSVRTFHGRLLSAAIDSDVALQPVAIRYLRNGESDPIAPFIGDDDLLSHLLRLFAHEQAQVEIHLLEPIVCEQQERAMLAFKAQEAIRQVVSGVPQPRPQTECEPAAA
ncbi:lysophospholipid acyltransferase family protein [Pseudomonas helleri]|uniref:1-acyl-sn-glycerol-3-phosphate acyltransferase n=1 Tax=Pseudomonas helleri TaxID=1608996 RepID=A0A6L5HR68_9PSED|nr:lysophospholipid acyltransferase family protein [Pseudomonas helleri]MQU05763.1 1-acyl-sn-glycerol-3-phosphate acyltransferase [Pseudomonas helleri]